MQLGLDDVRRSILAALGLLSACGPLVESNDGSGNGSGTIASADASASVGEETAMPPPVSCESPTVILQSNVGGSLPTGWEVCDGVIHRVSIETCEAPEPTEPACSLTDEQGCLVDADCTEQAHGRCIEQADLFGEEPFCLCSYGCATDSDCDPGEICACGGQATDYPARSHCIPATCTSDAGCGDGSLCMLGSGDSGCGISNSAACSTPQDTCMHDEDCPETEDCYPQADGHWACESFCCCGRPLLVDGCPVTAAAVARDDWSAAATVTVHDLPPAVRRRIAAHYTQCAQLEHASVASFARFMLELLAMGAPPSLLVAAQQAGLDEIDHAQRCFALASTYAASPIGPGPLAIAGTAPATTLEAIVAAVIDEACVSETLAAIEARAAARHAREPSVRATLETLAADELRHAALGWQTLRWALGLADLPTRARLLARLDSAIATAEHNRPPATIDGERIQLRAHGVLDPADRRAAHEEALAQVLRPCAAALRDHALAVAA
jgi:hypothetical protein